MVVAALGVASWHYSNEIILPQPHGPLETRLAAAWLDDSTITISGTQIGRRGRRWFLDWPGGSGVALDLVSVDSARATRRFRLLSGNTFAQAAVDLGSYPYSGDPTSTCELPFEEVRVAGPAGDCPAWLVPGSRTTWVVFVHGRAAGRGEALRAMPTIAALGLPMLVVTYRNDPDGPRSADGLYHLGATEWQDLEAGVRYALRHGARRVILFGVSMGGAIVASFLQHSVLTGSVAGVILDAPVLDWDAAVRLGARARRVPLFLTAFAEVVVTLRTGFQWSAEGKVGPGPFRTPVLLFHGGADGTVPIGPSESLAAALGERATLVKTAGAGHAQSWNFDPEGYEQALGEWIRRTAGSVEGRSRTATPRPLDRPSRPRR